MDILTNYICHKRNLLLCSSKIAIIKKKCLIQFTNTDPCLVSSLNPARWMLRRDFQIMAINNQILMDSLVNAYLFPHFLQPYNLIPLGAQTL